MLPSLPTPLLFSFSLKQRGGERRERCTHTRTRTHKYTHVSTSLRFVHLNLEFVSKIFSPLFFPVRAPKILLREKKNRKEDLEKFYRILRFRNIIRWGRGETFINKKDRVRYGNSGFLVDSSRRELRGSYFFSARYNFIRQKSCALSSPPISVHGGAEISSIVNDATEAGRTYRSTVPIHPSSIYLKSFVSRRFARDGCG